MVYGGFPLVPLENRQNFPKNVCPMLWVQHEDKPTALKLMYEWRRLCWFTSQLTLALRNTDHSRRQIQKKKDSSGICLHVMISELHVTGGVPQQRCIFACIWSPLAVFQKATAEAEEGHSRLIRQDTGCSDALCLGAPPVPGQPHYGRSKDDPPGESGINLGKMGQLPVKIILDTAQDSP